MSISPIFDIDFYKADHRSQYPEGTEMVFSNFTPRSSKLFNGSKYFDDKIVVFGIQSFIKEYLIEDWRDSFFKKDKDSIVSEYKRRMDLSLGEGAISVDHIADLHDLGYLPLQIMAIPEGSRVNMKVPVLTVWNTKPEFFWLVNYIESVMSSELWKPMTSATIAFEYKRILTEAAIKTGAPTEAVAIQGHDFSFRGMSGRQDAATSGMGHLLSFIGSDSVPAIVKMEEMYPCSDDDPVGVSVPASEHSVMCMGQKESEINTFRRFINELYPTGIVSIVSDTWDYWKVITEYLPLLKDEIMARQPNAIGLNKVVIRPDSGDPVRIICGYEEDEVVYFEGFGWAVKSECLITPDPIDTYYQLPEDPSKLLTEHEVKGSIQCMWETFGGTETEKGYKLLDEHIGLIYGDSITLDRAQEICDRLEAKGFASTNVVFGIGSYTYQYNTRDTFGFAMKATAGIVNGEVREIFKDPKTDNGTKKSARGFLKVDEIDGEYVLVDQVDQNEIESGVMVSVFLDGNIGEDYCLEDVKENLKNSI